MDLLWPNSTPVVPALLRWKVLGLGRSDKDDGGNQEREATMAGKDKGTKSDRKAPKKNLKEKRAAKKEKKTK
jgi:hypothetical protein